MIDCLSKSVRQQQFLAWSKTTDLTCPLTFAKSFSWPSRYLIISPLKEQKMSASSVSKGEQSGEFTSRIFSELVSEKNIQVIIIQIPKQSHSKVVEANQTMMYGKGWPVFYNIFCMFPATNKEPRLILLQPSPKYSREANKSTYLPYFKRFPNQKFHSQEKRRGQEGVAPRRFFTEEKEQPVLETTQNQVFSSYSIKERSPGKLRPRLFRQLYERQSNKIKRASQHSVGERNSRPLVNSSFNVHPSAYLTPAQLLRTAHNLTQYELSEVQQGYGEIYYWGQNCTKKLFNGDRRPVKEGDEGYPWAKGDHVAYRYEFVELLGEGSFGQVFKCLDHKQSKAPVALKMVKNNDKYLSQAKIQIKILNLIKTKDPISSKNCIEMRDYFPFRHRICMTFGLMAINLYELIKSNGYYGLPLDLIRRFVLQILNGIHFLHRNRVIHADLKPENILLKEMNKSGIKIIDFGSSCLENQTIYTYIQSRYYRAPEVILGLPYDRKIDIWSFGCIIAELHLGFPLFGGEDQHQQMCLIIEVLGLPPKDMLPNSKRWHVFFDHNNVLKPNEKRAPPASKSLALALQNADDSFVSFIRQCLEWNPDRRVQALELMRHEWVLKDLPGDFRDQHLKFISQEQAQLGLEQNSILRRSRKHTFTIRDKHRLIK